MVLRDAVLNDQIPEIAERQIYGFFAYRFGHAVFDFIRAEWGPDGVRDFVFDYRGQLGPNLEPGPRSAPSTISVGGLRHPVPALPAPAVPEDPDRHGRADRLRRPRPPDRGEQLGRDVSVRAFPSGDLGAAISTLGNDANVVLVSPRDRKLFKNLTKGYKTDYEYIVAQWLTTGPVGGVDLAVSPDGNSIAVFVRRERGRELLLLNALDGRIQQLIPMPGARPAAEPGLLARRAHGRLPRDPERPVRHLHLQHRLEGDRQPHQRRRLRLRADLLARRAVDLLLVGPGHEGQDLPDPPGRRRLARADHLRRLERRGRVALARRQDALLHLGPRQRHLQHLLDQPRQRRDEPVHQRRRRLLLAGRPASAATAPSGSSSRRTTSAGSCST